MLFLYNHLKYFGKKKPGNLILVVLRETTISIGQVRNQIVIHSEVLKFKLK